jgi:hypothetical protein
MSYVFSFTGTTSVLTSHFQENIHLHDGQWKMGLLGFAAFHTLANVDVSNNLFFYSKPRVQQSTAPAADEPASDEPAFDELPNRYQRFLGEDEDPDPLTQQNLYPINNLQLFKIPTGAYNLEDLEFQIQSKLPPLQTFQLTLDPNTSKTAMYSSLNIHFLGKKNLAQLLGFNSGHYRAGVTHESKHALNLTKVSTIRINCNITRGSFLNGEPAHILYEFSPRVPPRHKITEQPQQPIYLPVNVQRIDKIILTITDQDGNPLDFGTDTIHIRLHLKRWEALPKAAPAG